jgi:hypothetical protein
MGNKEFKKSFSEIAKLNGFEYDFGGWFKESLECILVLDLQKSNFASSYYMNIKIYVHEMFGNHYIKSKKLVKTDIGDIFRRQPHSYDDVFRLDNHMNENERKSGLDELFNLFILSFASKALSRQGIKQLEGTGEVFILPAVKAQLEKMDGSKRI